MDKIPEKKMTAFCEGLLDYIHVNQADLSASIDPDQKVSDSLRQTILKVAEDYINCSMGDDAEACSAAGAGSAVGAV